MVRTRGAHGGINAEGVKGLNPTGPCRRHRVPWARLLRRVLYLDAPSCPRRTTAMRSVPMVVLALLSDAEVMGESCGILDRRSRRRAWRRRGRGAAHWGAPWRDPGDGRTV